ncbi:MAG TPA: N-acetylmuramoyl-L-alanine amidase [Chthoniobacterales bacterium]|jgi:N-acetylmuramoyl-L-alanine amidase
MFLTRLLGALLLAATLVRQSVAGDWQVVHADGRDYVTFANVAEFYHFPQFERAARTISLRSDERGINAEAGSTEFTINGVRFFSDYPLLTEGDHDLISAFDVAKIIEPVLRPNKIAGIGKIETVVLDPGHGGTDNGAAGLWGSEKTYTLDVARIARDELRRAGFKVEMTRTNDSTVSLEDRVAFANRFSHAVFISIHFNSATGGAGVESYALAPAGVPSNAATSENHSDVTSTNWYPGNNNDPTNMALAATVQGALLSRVSTFDRGVRHARFHVLRESAIPAVLVEAGFLTDPNEGAEIADLGYRQKLGRAIALAMTNFNAAAGFPTTTFAANSPRQAPAQKPSADIRGAAQ